MVRRFLNKSNMLSSISWQHYLAAVITLTTCYYGYVVLRYYQNELFNFFNRKQASAELPNVTASSANIMGYAKPDYGTALSNIEEVQFAEPTPDEQPPHLSVRAADVAATMEVQRPAEEELETEAGRLIDAFKDVDDKPEFLSLLRILVESYITLSGVVDLQVTMQRIINYAQGKLVFELTMEDAHPGTNQSKFNH
jgi:hypothetical protein